jgi:hypothetical protein
LLFFAIISSPQLAENCIKWKIEYKEVILSGASKRFEVLDALCRKEIAININALHN